MSEARNEENGSAGTAAYVDRIVAAALGFAEMASIALGDRLGWYRALAGAGDAGLTPDELAQRSNTQPRYAKEWLEQQAVAGLLTAVLDAEPLGGPSYRFALPAGAAAVLVDEDSLEYTAPVARMLVTAVGHFPDLLQAYRDGGGVAWSELGDDGRESQAELNKPWFDQRLGAALAASAELHAILSRPGARIMDVGAGFGWSTLALADAYPGAEVVGVDIDEPSIRRARENAGERGSSGRVSFALADAGDMAAPGSCDAVFIFEALHDMPFPVRVLSAIRNFIKPDGAVVVMDEAVADTFAPAGDEVERLMYGYSLLVCLPDSLSTPGSVGTGTPMRQATLERYAVEAGFSRVERLPIEDFSVFRFYRLHV
ncbi:class I SAM-dependent methyltransferase [Arthrobacter glacialis]|uniref:SAM-dependent methyltransferase n=1 Tax=Arthrobacter glacialis TaxID=1664 RepID=A0A2S3ZYW7_ARTGL|nr:methyltransferase domain-containing protein [Arthrobacter glacialis]POH74431.1 SAM-dependent methyltransferase [Arthrobacter glacialis]